MNKVKRPVFIIGTGRCGSTVLANILSRHDEFAWPSNHMMVREDIQSHVPCETDSPRFLKWKSKRSPRKFLHEPYELWNKYYPGFAEPFRDLNANDVPVSLPQSISAAFAREQLDQQKSRFMTKYTGWSRICFINRIFPDARFIHVIRDPRAVAYSLNRVYFWKGWQGPSNWRWGPLSDENQQIWAESDLSFFVLAGIQWKVLVENIQEQSQILGARFLQVRYEDLVNCSKYELRRVCEFCEVDSRSDWLQESVLGLKGGKNMQWASDLCDEEISKFNNLLGPTIGEYGYSTKQPNSI